MKSNVVSFRTTEKEDSSGDVVNHGVMPATDTVLPRKRKTAQRPPLPTAQVYQLAEISAAETETPVQANGVAPARPKARLTDTVFKYKFSKTDRDPFGKRLTGLS